MKDQRFLTSEQTSVQNRFDQCPIKGCFSEIWKYNFKSHLQEKHPHEDPDDYTEWRITGAEMNFLLSQKKAKKESKDVKNQEAPTNYMLYHSILIILFEHLKCMIRTD